MIESQEAILVDVRSKKEYDTMHIRNAINIPVEEIGNGEMQITPECKIIVYCATGTRSKTAISTLNRLGFNNIYIWEYASLATFPYKNMIIYNKN